jgi:hypothetical protein
MQVIALVFKNRSNAILTNKSVVLVKNKFNVGFNRFVIVLTNVFLNRFVVALTNRCIRFVKNRFNKV